MLKFDASSNPALCLSLFLPILLVPKYSPLDSDNSADHTNHLFPWADPRLPQLGRREIKREFLGEPPDPTWISIDVLFFRGALLWISIGRNCSLFVLLMMKVFLACSFIPRHLAAFPWPLRDVVPMVEISSSYNVKFLITLRWNGLSYFLLWYIYAATSTANWHSQCLK